MGRTLLTLGLFLATATVFGQADSIVLKSTDASTAKRCFITLDGKPAGWALSPDTKPIGLRAWSSHKTQVSAEHKPQVAFSQNKLTFRAGEGMSEGFYNWIRASFDGAMIRKSGEVHACDIDYKSVAMREFTDAYISEVTFPTLDGSSKEPAYMTIKIDAENVTYKKGDGNVVQAKVAPAKKKWQCSNFRVEIGDLPCTRVSKVSSFTWKQGVIEDGDRMFRDVAGIPVGEQTRTGETQNLKLTMPMSAWDAWENWMTSSLLSHSGLKRGSITVMTDPDRHGTIEAYTLILEDVSMVRMTLEAYTPYTPDDVSSEWFSVTLHVNRIDFRRA